MKQLNSYLNEALINKNTKLSKIEKSYSNNAGYDNSLLDININTLNILKTKLLKYFKGRSWWHNVRISQIDHLTEFTYDSQEVKIKCGYILWFYSTPNFAKYRLYIGETYNKTIVFQLIKNSSIYKVAPTIEPIIGEFQLKTNFLEWLYSKYHNHSYSDENLFKLFGIDKNFKDVL